MEVTIEHALKIFGVKLLSKKAERQKLTACSHDTLAETLEEIADAAAETTAEIRKLKAKDENSK